METEQTFLIPFTQYLLPDGRTRQIKWECTSHEQEVKARALLEAKAYFEAEMLAYSGDISLTCEIKGNDGEMHTLAHEICENNPAVIKAVERLVERAHEALVAQSNVE